MEIQIVNGKDRTEKLVKATIGWLLKKGYSCHSEIGVMPWGRRRADVLALNLKRNIILVEIKQSWQDFKYDEKFDQYLPHCNQMYFVFPYDLWEGREEQIRERIDARFGLAVLEQSGLVRSHRSAPSRNMKKINKRNIITRLAWRGGTSKRNSRRTKQHI